MVWIHAAVSEKLEFTDGRTDDGRTTDACAITVALLTKSSRAKNVWSVKTSFTVLSFSHLRSVVD